MRANHGTPSQQPDRALFHLGDLPGIQVPVLRLVSVLPKVHATYRIGTFAKRVKPGLEEDTLGEAEQKKIPLAGLKPCKPRVGGVYSWLHLCGYSFDEW